jgi:Brp/Blh family beta-carotene 15,15'-monooxygenase
MVSLVTLAMRGKYQFLLPVFGLMTLGITHGAVDHELDPSSRESKLFFFSIYCSGIAAYFALWWGTPGVALFIFLFYASGHFGECQWRQAYARPPANVVELTLARTWGLFAAIFAPAYHWDETLPILREILRDPRLTPPLSLEEAKIFSLMLAAAALVSIFSFESLATLSRKPKSDPFTSTVLLILFLILLPLIPGFLCFFCFWHSWDSIQHQINARGWSFSEYARRAIPFTAFAWIGLIFLVFALQLESKTEGFWAVLFITLGALTVSHSQTMRRFYLSLPSNSEKKTPSLP